MGLLRQTMRHLRYVLYGRDTSVSIGVGAAPGCCGVSLSFTTSAAAGDAAALQAAGATASGFKCYAFYFDAIPLTLAGPCRAEWQAAACHGAHLLRSGCVCGVNTNCPVNTWSTRAVTRNARRVQARHSNPRPPPHGHTHSLPGRGGTGEEVVGLATAHRRLAVGVL